MSGRNSTCRRVCLACLIYAVMSYPAWAQTKLDPKLPEYKPAQGVSGNLKSIGSDTMNNEMTLWAEGFLKFYPNVQAEIEGKGSTTGPPALIDGTAHFAPMSRPMKGKEIDDFKKKHGFPPTALPTSIDMLAVYVHKDNPIKRLTMQQVDAIFSRTRKGGFDKAINTWGDLGLGGEWKDKPIALYGRNSASGTYGYFREHALFNGDFRDEVKEQPGSSSVVQGVASDKYAIGYSGIGYKTADVRAVPLAPDSKSEAVPAEADRAYAGEYPLARMLLVYVNRKPGAELDPLRREFVRYLYSKQGQSDVLRCGYLPIGEVIATKALASVGLKR
ncbi:MAG: phosphate ABC transporter substrate-binding protein [Planctomycetes bacterium]|nr:phosphate ABC transporter substrate-binding protein [Planctomycetota bacterium]